MVDSCNLVLYDNHSHQGTSKSYSGDTDLAAGGHHHRDRDHSAKLSGSCKNTSYLVFEHPWGHKGTNGGLAYLVGESDKPGNLHKTGQNDYEKGRYWERSGRADNNVRINIPSEDVNEGRMREDIKVFGKRNTNNAGDTHLHLYRDNNGNPNANDQWLTGIYNDQNSIKKGQPCPGGDAYWKNAINPEISCVYNVKTGNKLGRIRTLHSEITNSTIPSDPRKSMFDKIVTKYCTVTAERLNDKVTSGSGDDSTCRGFSNAKALATDYCKQGDKIKTDTMLCTKEADSLGPTLYDELAAKYCDANKDDPFCGCYNVVTNKCKSEDIDKEIKRLEDGRKPIEGVRYVWYGFDNKIEYLNIAQIEVYSGGKNIVKNIDDSKVTVGSNLETTDGTKYPKNQMFDGNYDTYYHSGIEAGWKTISNTIYNNQNLTGKFVSIGDGADIAYNAELGGWRQSSLNVNRQGQAQDVASVADCKKVCASLPKCKSTLYDKIGKSCHMLSATTADTSTLSNTNTDIIEKIGDSQHNYVKIDLGKDYTIDSVKIFNRKSCGGCDDRWSGSFVKLLDSSGNLIKASEKVVGDYKQGGERIISFFDNGVGAANAKTLIPGCKITVPIRRTLTDLPRKYSAALDGTDKCWGNVCASKGDDNFVPEGTIDAICSKSMTICNVDLSVGNIQGSEINIEQSCGEQEGEPSRTFRRFDSNGTPAPMGSPSVPSTPSPTPTPTPTPTPYTYTITLERRRRRRRKSVLRKTECSNWCGRNIFNGFDIFVRHARNTYN